MKAYVVGSKKNCADLIPGVVMPETQEEADVVIFSGGRDVAPAMYGCLPHPATDADPERDRLEAEVFARIRPDQLALGICRGAQMLCVLNGGILVQDCKNHYLRGAFHDITDGRQRYPMTSTHHQMQYPFLLPPNDYTLLWWADRLSGVWEGDRIDPAPILERGEPEIVVYHRPGKPVCLAVQGHPERMLCSPTAAFIYRLICEYAPSGA
jgi:hypothetical protein